MGWGGAGKTCMVGCVEGSQGKAAAPAVPLQHREASQRPTLRSAAHCDSSTRSSASLRAAPAAPCCRSPRSALPAYSP